MSGEANMPDEIALCEVCGNYTSSLFPGHCKEGDTCSYCGAVERFHLYVRKGSQVSEEENRARIVMLRQGAVDQGKRILELTGQNDALAVDLDAARRELAERDHATAMLIVAAETETAQALERVEELRETLGCDTAEYIEQLEATARTCFRLKKQLGLQRD